MPIRLIAMDLDDTVLRDDLTVSKRTLQAINQARAKGVLVTVATGRMPLSCQRFIDVLDIRIPVIMCHGAIIKDMNSGEIIFRKVIDKETASEAIRIMQAEGMHCQIYLQDKVYTNQLNKWSQTWKKLSTVQSEEADLLAVLKQGESAEKIVSIDEESLISHKYQTYQSQFEGKIHFTVSKPNFLEMLDAGVNKGAALAFLAEMHGIKREEVLAIGDSLNDLEMIRYAGIGVAMGNARPELKKEADYVTGTNDQDGAAEAIEKFVLSDE
ncbi:MAG: HAD family phosphatase [Peptococcaceae bacterium]|nr:HAD family phosphatase [Peptococcaceae bacterium]